MKWEPSKRQRECALKIREQANKIPDGWMIIKVPPCEETHAEGFTVKVARIPFERWMRHTYAHRFDEWPNVCHIGMKMMNDDRNHSDWWVSTGFPIEYSYGRKETSSRDFLSEDDPNYRTPPDNEEELINKSKRLLDHCWHIRFDSIRERTRNSIFLASCKKEIEGRIMHVRSPEDIPAFVEECKRWKRAANSQLMIAVVPDCSIKYDLVIRHAGAIITEIGSAAAHLVKVAREDNIPVIMCPNAFKEYFQYESVRIKEKTITERY